MPTATRNRPLRSEKMGGRRGRDAEERREAIGGEQQKGPYDDVVEA